MKQLIIFNPRFDLQKISKYAPENFKNQYKQALNELNLIFTESYIDKEDWIESVIPLIEIFKFKKSLREVFISKYNEFDISSFTDYILLGLYFEVKDEFSHLNRLFPVETSVVEDTYFKSKTFLKYANRKIFGVASLFDEEQLDSLNDWKELNTIDYRNNKIQIDERIFEIENCKNNSLEKELFEISKIERVCFIKTIVKKWSTFIDLRCISGENDIYQKLIEKFGYEYSERLSSSKDSVLIQEYARIEYEYRFFVINGKIVSGAGCIEEFTPLNNIEQFDCQLRKNRKLISKIEINAEIVNKLKVFAEEVVASFNEEGVCYEHYTLDVGIINGQPGIIELNDFKNVGYYAGNYSYILKNLF